MIQTEIYGDGISGALLRLISLLMAVIGLLFTLAIGAIPTSAQSNCDKCQKSQNGAKLLCTLEMSQQQNPIDQKDVEKAQELIAAHQKAMSEGLIAAESNKSMSDRHYSVGKAAEGKSLASSDTSKACQVAREKAESSCQGQCTCENCDELMSLESKWKRQAIEDYRYATDNFKVVNSVNEQENRRKLRRYNEDMMSDPLANYPQGPK